MPTENQVIQLFEKHLGKEAAQTILAKMDKMTKAKATPAQMETAVIADISAQIEKQVVDTVAAKIGPISPIKVKPISVSVQPKIKIITIGPKISVLVGPPIQVKVGPAVKVGPGPR